MEKKISSIIKILFFISLLLSIAVNYYVMLVRHDYIVFTNPDGPVLEEE